MPVRFRYLISVRCCSLRSLLLTDRRMNCFGERGDRGDRCDLLIWRGESLQKSAKVCESLRKSAKVMSDELMFDEWCLVRECVRLALDWSKICYQILCRTCFWLLRQWLFWISFGSFMDLWNKIFGGEEKDWQLTNDRAKNLPKNIWDLSTPS